VKCRHHHHQSARLFQRYQRAERSADFAAVCRPLIRQQDLPNRWLKGIGGLTADCNSYNCCVGSPMEGGARCIQKGRTEQKSTSSLFQKHLEWTLLSAFFLLTTRAKPRLPQDAPTAQTNRAGSVSMSTTTGPAVASAFLTASSRSLGSVTLIPTAPQFCA
jgi:hypothetical protein